MSTNTETSAPPSVTINDKKYLISDLDDNSKNFLNEIYNRNDDLFIHGFLNLQIIENFEWGSLWKMLLRL